MRYPTPEQVEQADHEQLARWYRFLPVSQTERELDVANRVYARLNELGGFTPELSKKIGWQAMTDTQDEACPTCGAPVIPAETRFMHVCNHTDCHNQVAALLGALGREVKRRFHSQGCPHWRSCGEMACTCGAIADWEQTDALLANLPAEALEIAWKVQAHDEMVAASRCPNTQAVDIVPGTASTYPSRRGCCLVCGYEGPVNDSGNLWRHSRAVLAERRE